MSEVVNRRLEPHQTFRPSQAFTKRVINSNDQLVLACVWSARHYYLFTLKFKMIYHYVIMSLRTG